MLEAAVDFGGTLTNVVVASGDEERYATVPGVVIPTRDDLAAALQSAGCDDPRALDVLALTGGRSAGLSEVVVGGRVVLVDEVQAIAAGGLLAGAMAPAIVVSLGTGTGIVLARADGSAERLIGSGIGGGTVIGLARLLVGDYSVATLGELAAAGDPAGCDLTVEDILGGATGPVPADATAAHFGRMGRQSQKPSSADQMAALVGMVLQNSIRIALAELSAQGASSLILIGGFLAEPGFRRAIEANPMYRRFPVPIAADPGYGVVRGALDIGRKASRRSE